mgnify:CR=1 FL=1
MNYEPEHLERWTFPDSYAGATWYDYYVFLGRHRESEILTNVNYELGLKAIGGPSDTVHEVRESHWAVGWVEWIAIHESDTQALEKADEIVAALADYPVLDEEAYSQRQWDEMHRYWIRIQLAERISWCQDAETSIFAARRDDIPEPVELEFQDSEMFY